MAHTGAMVEWIGIGCRPRLMHTCRGVNKFIPMLIIMGHIQRERIMAFNDQIDLTIGSTTHSFSITDDPKFTAKVKAGKARKAKILYGEMGLFLSHETVKGNDRHMAKVTRSAQAVVNVQSASNCQTHLVIETPDDDYVTEAEAQKLVVALCEWVLHKDGNGAYDNLSRLLQGQS